MDIKKAQERYVAIFIDTEREAKEARDNMIKLRYKAEIEHLCIEVEDLKEKLADNVPESIVKGWEKHCECCSQCTTTPCDGVAPGGLCDGVQCICDIEDEFDYNPSSAEFL